MLFLAQIFHATVSIVVTYSGLRMIITGLIGVILIEIYCAVMQHEFQNTDNKLGKGFAILGIYLFVVVFCKFPFLSMQPKDLLLLTPF